MNITIIINDTSNIYPTELLNTQHNSVIMADDIIAPIEIDKNDRFIFSFVSPAIKLALQTPVKGSGTAVKHVNAKYFANWFFEPSILFDLTKYFDKCLLTKNPDVFPLKYRVVKIIK